jgi:hypothetical protein
LRKANPVDSIRISGIARRRIGQAGVEEPDDGRQDRAEHDEPE